MSLGLEEEERFVSAVNYVLENEGYFANDQFDKSGPSSFGISLVFLKNLGMDIDGDNDVDVDDLLHMPKETAFALYKKEFWIKYNYNHIFSDILATKLLDTAVNIGPASANKLLQKACNAYLSHKIPYEHLNVDGILGKESLRVINEICTNAYNRDVLIDNFVTILVGYYHDICHRNYAFIRFLKGWLNRAKKLPK